MRGERPEGVWRALVVARIGGLMAVVLAVAGATGGCTGREAPLAPTKAVPSTDASDTGASPVATVPTRGPTIPQPPLRDLNRRTRRRLAPAADRVDLAVPTFSNPTAVTNRLFPIGRLRSAVLVGKLGGRPWRAETTLLPATKVVDWGGQRIEARQSQFVAYLDGRIFEVAVDLYAQADDGSVWYLGEDAFTYRNGRPVDTEGTWRAGIQGPPAMIMPGHPHVGDVYRTENIPGLVFEQVTVERVGVTLKGPTGQVPGGLVARELHMDEARLEDKVFAPGYGEFFSGGGRTFESTALAVPVDALPPPVPGKLSAVVSDAIAIADATRRGGWGDVSVALGRLRRAWRDIGVGGIPPGLAGEFRDAAASLGRDVASHDRHTPTAAIRVAGAALDLELRYRPPAEVDAARFGLWTRQLQADAALRDPNAVVGDVATLEWIRGRLALPHAAGLGIDDDLRSMEASAEAGELPAAAADAVRLRESMAALEPGT